MTIEELKQYFAENRIKDVQKHILIPVQIKLEEDSNRGILSYSMNRTLANEMTIEDFESGPFFDNFVKDMNINPENITKSESYNVSKTEQDLHYSHLFLTPDICIKYQPHTYKAWLYYSNALNLGVLNYFIQATKKFAIKDVREKKFYLLCDENGHLSSWRVKAPELKNMDINLSYNDDFAPINDLIIKQLAKNDSKGIVLLHGVPGTGKTSYIRYLMGKINKKMIYVPTEYAHYIGSKEFMSFMLAHKDNILVIEDAESVIKARENNTNSATANLLNLGDGLLSDALSIQIILTFNTDLSTIDHALLRKGRIIARYEFEPLSIEKSQKLSDSLGFQSKINEKMTLAEIYNQNEEDFTANKKKEVGFSIKAK